MSLESKTNKKPCFLITWSLTGKRGRSPTSTNHILSSSSSATSSPEDQQTAHYLLMLSSSAATREDNHQKYQCGICGKRFVSHQALGGHRASHFKIMKTRVALVEEQPQPFYHHQTKEKNHDDQVFDEVPVLEKKKKNKKHECSICRKMFSSGQALGGHKRRHWDKNKDDNKTAVPKTKKKKSMLISTLCFDLNLPPPLSDNKEGGEGEGEGLISSTNEGSSSSTASPLIRS